VTDALDIEERELSRSELTLPRVALGCGNFIGIGSALDLIGQGLTEEQAHELMDAAWDMGITHFDTADAYGGGHSERVIGSWIASRRRHPTLTTKTFNPIFPNADHGLSAKRIARRLPASLERLGVSRVELYLAHDYDHVIPIQETMAEFERLREARRITAYGVSNFNEVQLLHAVRAGSPVAVQNSYSLLERGDEVDVLPFCQEHTLSYIVFSPLAGGWMTGKYRRGESYPGGSRMTQRPDPYQHLVTERTFDALEALEEFATARGMSMAGVALAWVLSDDRVAQVVVGPGRPEHLDPVREALERPLTWQETDQLGAIFA
jgi:aryl-alcohol dehydrogenase-like predicted oxidoreductase